MTQTFKIKAIWAVSTLAIVVTLLGTQFHSRILDNKTAQLADEFNQANIPLTKAETSARILSRQIFAKLFDEPNMTRGLVLGDSTVPLKQEEIADISTPTVIRIFNKVTGSISFPEFDIDFMNFELIPTQRIYSEDIDALGTGTGFFVDDKGHIMTNSHVVDKDMVKEDFAASAILYYGSVVEQQLYNLSPEQQEALRQKIIATYGDNLVQAADAFAMDMLTSIYSYITENAKMQVEQQLTVLDPARVGTSIKTEEELKSLASSALPAKIVDWNPDYMASFRDVALIQIEKTSTPFLTVNPDATPSTGQQVFVIGFPANAEVSASDLFNRTMTGGIINAIKDMEGTQVYQTDAKISPGSSGSPMLNEDGEVIGIISFLNDGELGDNFGYAVPIKHGQDLMADNGINPSNNPYITTFTAGLDLARDQLCRKANEQFAMTKTASSGITNPNLQKYIDKCNNTIAAGQSKDGTWYQVMEKVKAVPIYAWAGFAVLIGISVAAWFLLRRLKRVQPLPQPQATPAV